MAAAVIRSTRAPIVASSAASAFALTVTSSCSVSRPSRRSTADVSPAFSVTAVVADVNPCSSATIEHTAVVVGTSANVKSPCSFDTSILGSLVPHVSVTVTPGTTSGAPSVPAIDTEPATEDEALCADAPLAIVDANATATASGATRARVPRARAGAGVGAASLTGRCTSSARPTALQASSRTFRTSATARPATGSRWRRPAANDEVASSMPMRIGTNLNATVTPRLTVSRTTVETSDAPAGQTSRSV